MSKMYIVNRPARGGAPGETLLLPIGWAHFCPGCQMIHTIHTVPTFPGEKTNKMQGLPSRPTFRGSMRFSSTFALAVERHCHYKIKGGKIHFLRDCTHKLRGQVVEMPEWQPTPGLERMEETHDAEETQSTETDSRGIAQSAGQQKDADGVRALPAQAAGSDHEEIAD